MWFCSVLLCVSSFSFGSSAKIPKHDGGLFCPYKKKGILYPNGSAYNPEETACIAAAAAAAASNRGEIAGERDAGSDERYRLEAAAVHTLRVHESNVTWLPVMAAAGWASGNSISNGAEAVGGGGIEQYAGKKLGG